MKIELWFSTLAHEELSLVIEWPWPFLPLIGESFPFSDYYDEYKESMNKKGYRVGGRLSYVVSRRWIQRDNIIIVLTNESEDGYERLVNHYLGLP